MGAHDPASTADSEDSENLSGAADSPLPGSIGSGEPEEVRLIGDGIVGGSGLPADNAHFADNDLFGAMTSIAPDTLPNVEHVLDQLTIASDLFDVPAIDFDNAIGS